MAALTGHDLRRPESARWTRADAGAGGKPATSSSGRELSPGGCVERASAPGASATWAIVPGGHAAFWEGPGAVEPGRHRFRPGP